MATVSVYLSLNYSLFLVLRFHPFLPGRAMQTVQTKERSARPRNPGSDDVISEAQVSEALARPRRQQPLRVGATSGVLGHTRRKGGEGGRTELSHSPTNVIGKL